MRDAVEDILNRLKPFTDRLVFGPLTEQEMKELEEEVGIPAPTSLRTFLLRVRLLQDLTIYGNSFWPPYESLEEFIEGRAALLELERSDAAQLFPFSDNDGDMIVVQADDKGDEGRGQITVVRFVFLKR